MTNDEKFAAVEIDNLWVTKRMDLIVAIDN
jgi:hypothetical protein